MSSVELYAELKARNPEIIARIEKFKYFPFGVGTNAEGMFKRELSKHLRKSRVKYTQNDLKEAWQNLSNDEKERYRHKRKMMSIRCELYEREIEKFSSQDKEIFLSNYGILLISCINT